MKLYIANTTKQNHEFTYRVPEVAQIRAQQIPVGACVQVWKDDSRPLLEAVIDQHRRYGLIDVREIDRSKDFIGLCYSFDAPINTDAIMRAMNHNDLVLVERGREMRKQAAAAISATVDAATADAGQQLASLDVTLEEVDRRDGTTTSVNETVNVAKEGRGGRRSRH